MYTLVACLTMRLSNSYNHFIKHTHNHPTHLYHKQTQCLLINRNTKNCAKMAQEMDLIDNMSDNVVPTPVTKMTTCLLAQLVEKLKQLMDTPKQNPNEMEYDLEDLKKQSRSKNTNSAVKETGHKEQHPPEIK